MTYTVLLTEPIHEAGLEALRARPDVVVVMGQGLSKAEMARAIEGADAIGTRVYELAADVLSRANGLRVVAKHGVGCDNIDVAHCSGRRIPVMITASANKISVAEQTMMMMLALAKDAVGYDRAVRSGDWRYRFSLRAFELAGRTLLIVGFGRIGREVAARARAFGMRVLVNDIAMDVHAARALGCEVVEDFRAHLGNADILTLHTPKTQATTGMIGAGELAAMRSGALLINCARGGLVDEDALRRALENGQLGGAALDVFDLEPLPADHPLLKLPNVLVSPHSAGSTAESGRRMALDTAQNILDALDGKPDPANVFNPDAFV